MITINGHQFAKNAKEFNNSSCYGYYRRRKNGVLLMDKQKDPLAYIVNRKDSSVFAVTAHKCSEGKTRYMYGLARDTELLLGLDSVRYTDQPEYLQSAISSEVLL